MRLVVSSLFALAITPAILAQGLVNFANTPSTPVYVQEPDSTGPYSIMNAPAGSFRFGLFLGRPNQTWFFTGVYAANTGVNGLFSGGVAAVPGWPAGASTNYFVAGWSGTQAFQGQWLDGHGLPAFFGVSLNGLGISGNGSSIPALNLFDGGSGTIPPGFFQLANHLVPEPSSAGIAIFGAAATLVYRMRNKAKVTQFADETSEACQNK
jgi:hypothetical protein